MYTYWAFVRTVVGGLMKVYAKADTAYQATIMLRAQYGDKLISEAAYTPN